MLTLNAGATFQHELLRVLGLTRDCGAGEILSVASKIVPGDYESWYEQYEFLDRTRKNSAWCCAADSMSGSGLRRRGRLFLSWSSKATCGCAWSACNLQAADIRGCGRRALSCRRQRCSESSGDGLAGRYVRGDDDDAWLPSGRLRTVRARFGPGDFLCLPCGGECMTRHRLASRFVLFETDAKPSHLG